MATALGGLPLIAAAFGSGEISYSEARAVTLVATAENEEVLLTSARGMSASELEKLCRMVGSVGNDTEAAEPERRFSQRAVGDGMIRMSVTVPADEAAVVSAALGSFAPAPNRRAEGLVAMAYECSRGPAGTRPIEALPKSLSESKRTTSRARRTKAAATFPRTAGSPRIRKCQKLEVRATPCFS